MPGGRGVDSLIVGFYRAGAFIYAASVRAGLVPALRRRLSEKLAPLEIAECPFAKVA